MSSNIAIQTDNLAKTYRLYNKPADRLLQGIFGGKPRYREKKALLPLSLTILKGETLGIVGSNGSGKSTLLQLICGTLMPTSGTCKTHGKIAALLELGSGFNPEFTGKENIYLNASLLGLSREETNARYQDIIDFSGLGNAVNQPVKTYSSGMYVRLAFAVVSAVEPDIFIIDEALAVGDERFQRKCYNRIKALKEQGTTILFVSHSANTVLDICDRAVLLDAGELLFAGLPMQVISQYHHLIYAPESKREDVRNQIKSCSVGSRALRCIDDDAINDDEAEVGAIQPVSNFIPDMKAETIFSHSTKGAEIKDFLIRNTKSEQVNLLVQREKYSLCFVAQFFEDIANVRFRYTIQKSNGVIVHSSSTKRCEISSSILKSGDIFKVSFNFNCLLLSGYYYITLNCSGLVNGENRSLHRITDAIMFQVLPNPAIQAGGIVDLMSEPHIERVSELC